MLMDEQVTFTRIVVSEEAEHWWLVGKGDLKTYGDFQSHSKDCPSPPPVWGTQLGTRRHEERSRGRLSSNATRISAATWELPNVVVALSRLRLLPLA